MSELKQEVINQAVASSPALSLGVIITAVMSITLNQVFVTCSIVFILLQIAYLARKWWKEEKKE